MYGGYRFAISVILGLISAYFIFDQLFKAKDYHGPNSNKIRRKTFGNEKGCYKLVPIVHMCPISFKKERQPHLGATGAS